MFSFCTQETTHSLVKNPFDLPFPGCINYYCQSSYRCLQINEHSFVFCWSITSCETPTPKCLPQLNFPSLQKKTPFIYINKQLLLPKTKQERGQTLYLFIGKQNRPTLLQFIISPLCLFCSLPTPQSLERYWD